MASSPDNTNTGNTSPEVSDAVQAVAATADEAYLKRMLGIDAAVLKSETSKKVANRIVERLAQVRESIAKDKELKKALEQEVDTAMRSVTKKGTSDFSEDLRRVSAVAAALHRVVPQVAMQEFFSVKMKNADQTLGDDTVVMSKVKFGGADHKVFIDTRHKFWTEEGPFATEADLLSAINGKIPSEVGMRTDPDIARALTVTDNAALHDGCATLTLRSEGKVVELHELQRHFRSRGQLTKLREGSSNSSGALFAASILSRSTDPELHAIVGSNNGTKVKNELSSLRSMKSVYAQMEDMKSRNASLVLQVHPSVLTKNMNELIAEAANIDKEFQYINSRSVFPVNPLDPTKWGISEIVQSTYPGVTTLNDADEKKEYATALRQSYVQLQDAIRQLKVVTAESFRVLKESCDKANVASATLDGYFTGGSIDLGKIHPSLDVRSELSKIQNELLTAPIAGSTRVQLQESDDLDEEMAKKKEELKTAQVGTLKGDAAQHAIIAKYLEKTGLAESDAKQAANYLLTRGRLDAQLQQIAQQGGQTGEGLLAAADIAIQRPGVLKKLGTAAGAVAAWPFVQSWNLASWGLGKTAIAGKTVLWDAPKFALWTAPKGAMQLGWKHKKDIAAIAALSLLCGPIGGVGTWYLYKQFSGRGTPNP